MATCAGSVGGPDVDEAEPLPTPGKVGAIRLAMRVNWGKEHGWGPKGFPPLKTIARAYPVLTAEERATLRAVYGTEGRDPAEPPTRKEKIEKLAEDRKAAEASLILACTIIANDDAEAAGGV